MTAASDHPERILHLVASGDVTLPDLEICWCCAGILGRPQRTAVYWWQTARGYWLGLCTRCCAIWRQGSAGEPELQSLCITSQRPASPAA
jgi:hypothetical protein